MQALRLLTTPAYSSLDTLNTLITSLMCVALSVALTGPAWYERDQPAGLARLELTEEAMGSSFSLVLFGPDRAGLEAAAAAAFAEAHRLDRLLSNYLAESEWSAMNREAASRPVRVTPELFALLSDCLEYSRMSDGAFDITVGPLIKVWGFYKGEGGLPQPKEVKDALNRVGYRHVQLDPGPRTVRFARPGMDLDPGGIGKGYAVDRMVEVLKQAGVRIALVSASGSSIYGLGAPPDEPQGWPITIRTPRDPSAAQRTSSSRTCRFPRLAATRSSSGRKAEPTPTSSTRGPATPRRGRRPFPSSRHGR